MELKSLLGETAAVQSLHEEITYASRCDAKVLVTGESGVGKEVVARLIHANSARRRAPLITVNCAAPHRNAPRDRIVRSRPRQLHRRLSRSTGRRSNWRIAAPCSWTKSARRARACRDCCCGFSRPAKFSASARTRSKRASTCASSRRPIGDLVDSVAAKTFREDLYYRLNVIHIRVPSLRERREDIPLFLEHFLDQFTPPVRSPPPDALAEATRALIATPGPATFAN